MPFAVTPFIVTLVRHPAPLIAPGVCYGALDVPLDPDTGAAIDAIMAAVRQAPVSTSSGGAAVWSSPRRRCRSLALRLTARPRIDHRLCELDFGAWEGQLWDAIPRAALDRWAASPHAFAPPGGETGAALIDRVRRFHAMLRHRGRDSVVVAHGGPLKLLAAMLRDQPPDLLAPAPAIGSVQHVRTWRTSS